MRLLALKNKTLVAAVACAAIGFMIGHILLFTIPQSITFSLSAFLLVVWLMSEFGSPASPYLYDPRIGVALFAVATALFVVCFMMTPNHPPGSHAAVCGCQYYGPRFLSGIISYLPALPYGISRTVELFSPGRQA